MAENTRDPSELMRINKDPTTYTPREGDVLEWCGHIRVVVDHVTPDGKVKLVDIPPNTTSDARLHLGDRPGPDPNEHPPLGIKTWASEYDTVAIEDLYRLLQHGWELQPTR